MARIFVYDGKELPDIDQSLTPDQIRQHMSTWYPELANAETNGPTNRPNRADANIQDEVYEFRRRVGTKGG